LPSLATPVFSFLAAAYIRLVGRTSRIVWVNRLVRDELEATGKGFIYAFWHGRQAFLVYLHRRDRLYTMISQSRDGELIARVCKSFKLGAVRGSSSRGGREAFLEMKHLLECGNRVAFTPDGPKGPFHRVQPGVLALAQMTGRPIVPVAYGARKKWIFKGGWDEFVVPKPMNKIVMAYGEPVEVKASDNLDMKAAELARALDEVTHKADSVASA